MTLSALQKNWIPQIENELQSIIEQMDFHGSEELRTMLTYHMGWVDDKGGGKRLRPLFSLLFTGALGADPEKVMPGALAIELLHNFTLIHDDIEDKSEIRHGRSTLWQRWGIPLAINAGDALFSISQLTMLGMRETLNPDPTVKASLKFNQVCLHLTRGQHMDITFEKERAVTEADYLEMVRGKTAALIGFTAWLGGLAAERDDTILSTLYHFGENLGLAFQMQDDLLGIWGDPAITGKSAASDLLSKKKTLPVLYGLVHSPEFRSMWQEEQASSEKLSQMAEILKTCGAMESVRDQAKSFTEKAFTILKGLFSHRNDYAIAIFELTESLLQRDF